jgi:hypothetical protein
MRLFTSKVFFSVLVCFITCALSEKGSILFLCSQTNYAWGYTHKGWFIDSSGAIRNYSFAQSDSIGYVWDTVALPSKMFDKLLDKSTPTGKKVSLDTLLSKLTLIESASSGILSRSAVCADAGLYRYSAFLYDALNSRPEEIICYQMGDVGICNSASAARKIARWLNSIDSNNIRFCAPPDSCLNTAISIAGEGPSIRNKPPRMVINGRTIQTSISQNGTIVIRAYSLRGELLSKPFKRFLTKGEHRIDLADILSGMQSTTPVLLEISTSGVKSATKTFIISQDR